jgi:hypothetical protein
MPQPLDSSPPSDEPAVVSFLSMQGMWVISPERIRYVKDQPTAEQRNASAMLDSPFLRISLAIGGLYALVDLVRFFNESHWLQFLWKLGVVFCIGSVLFRPRGQQLDASIPRDAVRNAEAYPPLLGLFGGHIMLHYGEKGILRHQRMTTRRHGELSGVRKKFLHAVGACERAGVDVDIISSSVRPIRATENVNVR